MPSQDRRRAKGRSESGRFLALPYALTDSQNYCELSHLAVRMLIDLGRQYNGNNNGDLCATPKTLASRGWSSNESISRALRDLEYYGFIVRTRQGGLNQCSLYAITWKAIDDCKGKLEISATAVASNDWRHERPRCRPRKAKRSTKVVETPACKSNVVDDSTPMVGVVRTDSRCSEWSPQ